jgi:uncharacterized protein involved in exopolysaccharide biosynthesis
VLQFRQNFLVTSFLERSNTSAVSGNEISIKLWTIQFTLPDQDIISPLAEQPQPPARRIDPVEAIAVIWKRRKFIAIFTGIVTAISIVVSVLLPPYYKSTATILPETQSSRLSTLSGISDLAALAGVNVGGEGSLTKLYPTIIKSEAVLKDVIYARYKTEEFPDSVNLIEYWEIKEKKPGAAYEGALKTLREALDVSMDLKTSILSMSLETKEPRLSADIVNNVLDGLDRFILTKRTTSASEQRKFIEGRLAEVKDDLTKSENALKVFRERNRQISSSPDLLLQQGRLERDLQINNTLFIELKKQYEIAKIEEVKNMPVINVLDLARPAVYKDRPKRSVIVIIAFLLTFLGVVVYVVGDKYYRSDVLGWINKARGGA